jgi:hypothetical protein
MRPGEQEPASTSGRPERNVFAFVDLAALPKVMVHQSLEGRMPMTRQGNGTKRTRWGPKPHLALPGHGLRIQRQESIKEYLNLPGNNKRQELQEIPKRKQHVEDARRLMSHHLKHSLKPKVRSVGGH